jgi:hypothetical protein
MLDLDASISYCKDREFVPEKANWYENVIREGFGRKGLRRNDSFKSAV